MVELYAPPNATDSGGFLEISRYVNNAVDGYLFTSMMFVIWIVIFTATKQYSSSKAFTFASFVCMVLSIVLATLNLLSPRLMYLFVVLTAAGALWIKLDK